MRRGVDGAVPAVAGNSSGATSGKSKRSCSGGEINRLRKETLNLSGAANLAYSRCGRRLLRCGMLDPPMSARGQTRSFGDVGSSVRFARKRTRLDDL